MSITATRQPTLTGALMQWWRRWQERRTALSDLATCGSEVVAIAHDLAVTPADLYVLAAKRPDATDLLSRRLATLRLDASGLGVTDGSTLRDLQRLCTTCDAKRHCASDRAQ